MLIHPSGAGCIKTVDPENKAISTMACLVEGAVMDGISADGKRLLIIPTLFDNQVVAYELTGE